MNALHKLIPIIPASGSQKMSQPDLACITLLRAGMNDRRRVARELTSKLGC